MLGEEAGLHFLLRLHTNLEDAQLEAAARERGIRLSFLTQYERQQGRAEAHTLVVSYPGLEEERLEAGLETLAQLLDQ